MTEHSAGRELDALVAEHVMGLKPCSRWGGSGGRTYVIHRNDDCDVSSEISGTYCFDVSGEHLTHYSASISGAWQVVEKLRKEGFFIFISYDSVDIWDVSFYPVPQCDGGDIVPLMKNACVAPLAICRAALKLMETKP